MSFQPVLNGIRQVLVERGIDADRAVTYDPDFGFRHPTLWGVILTWHRHAFADAIILDHDTAAERGLSIHGPADLVFVEDGVPKTFYFTCLETGIGCFSATSTPPTSPCLRRWRRRLQPLRLLSFGHARNAHRR